MQTHKKTLEIYDDIAEEYANVFDNDTSDNIYLDEFLSSLAPHSRILDLGCGTGRNTAYFHEKGFSVVGVDFSSEMLRIAREKYPNIDFREGDMRDVSFEEGSFDAVSLAYSLFHLEDQDAYKMLGIVRSILTTEGFVFLILQEGEGTVWTDEPLKEGEKIFLNLYSENKIRNFLESIGFQIQYVRRKVSNFEKVLPYNKLIILAKKKVSI